ncbi:VOC family protein [Kineococcus sp. SYSU DK003]|uniref:VOC family protein n=1 Tax=Kineococcus sp. SYSU DK003 TaxID=3383124 RepID=UPI003D7EB12D
MAIPFPRALHTVLDTTDARGLAEFYRELLALQYRPGDEPPADESDEPDEAGWLVLLDDHARRVLAFQQVDDLPRSTWPSAGVPMQAHVDFTVPDRTALDHHHERALALGATLLLDRTDDPAEPLYVYADPAGHPFCLLVG